MPFTELGISHTPEATIKIEKEMEMDGPKKSYPCLYIRSDKPVDLSDAGTATIKYKLIERSEKSRDDREEYCYELEIHAIEPGEAEEMEETPKKKRGSFRDLLDGEYDGEDE